MKWIQKIIVLLLCALLFTVPAFAKDLVVGGSTLGLSLETDGVFVVEFSSDIPKRAGLRRGDCIRAVNDTEVFSVAQLTQAVQSGTEPLKLTVVRDGREKNLRLSPMETAEGRKLGIYVRDHVSGIGTVTYYDPDSGTYGALGHGVNDAASAALLPLRSGSVLTTEVSSVERGKEGVPGSLRGSVTDTTPIGTVEKNTPQGIFGTITVPDGERLPAACAQEVHPGNAVIRSTVLGSTPRDYTVQICEVDLSQPQDRNMVIEITDPDLLAATGGIVQGMSGSPILQNGKLVGAVTHVLVNDPTTGYGIFIENMLDAAG